MKSAIIIPIGSHEQHGPHLPADTDYLIAKATGLELSNHFLIELDDGITISYSPEHKGFEETKSLTKKVFIAKIIEKLSFYEEKELRIIINAHGGNTTILKDLEKQSLNRFILIDVYTIMKEHFKLIRTTDIGGICHAGEFETSLMLYLYPDLVHLEKVTPNQIKLVPKLDPNYEGIRLKDWKTIELNKFGILGDPLQATKGKGQKWFSLLIQEIKYLLEIEIKLKKKE
ncbi:MAG: hypothetical protein EAX96_05095 [Candidatus Lokiarchaeota archaeon]|nr:hypothetical protein [Candidatus Lokiarchaeota archaeon]